MNMLGQSPLPSLTLGFSLTVASHRQIAKRYGQDVAKEALHRSTSDLQLKEKGRAYSFGYPASLATSETHDPGLLAVNTLPLR
jgi:hypothetical protein